MEGLLSFSANHSLDANSQIRLLVDFRPVLFASAPFLWRDETTQRISKEGVRLVRVAIPRPVQIADDLRRTDDAECAHVVLLADPRIDDFIIRTKREFCRAREFPVAQHLDL